jgi:hypothetical protein
MSLLNNQNLIYFFSFPLGKNYLLTYGINLRRLLAKNLTKGGGFVSCTIGVTGNPYKSSTLQAVKSACQMAFSH